MAVLTDLKNRGVADVFFVVCDGLKGLPASVNTVWPDAIVQTCIIHLIRGSFRYASRKYWDELSRDLRPIYTAPSEAAALAALDELDEKWGARYPAMINLWRNAWTEFVPFLDYDVEIRRVICSTNAIESLNARYRRAVKARGHFPTEQAAMKCLYLVTRSLDPKGTGQTRWATTVEASPERVRHHLRRPHASGGDQLTMNATYTVHRTDPLNHRAVATDRGERGPGPVGHEEESATEPVVRQVTVPIATSTRALAGPPIRAHEGIGRRCGVCGASGPHIRGRQPQPAGACRACVGQSRVVTGC